MSDFSSRSEHAFAKPKHLTFVSHASEDKTFVKQLVDTLLRYSVDTWYDAYEIRPGDSIRQRVNEGLRQANYGVIVLSEAFFAKTWTLEELDALHGILQQGRLIPIIFRMTVEEVRARDPLIAAVRAIVVDDETPVRHVVAEIARTILGVGRFENGTLVYRNETVSLTSVPMDEHMRITDALFENCVVQGPAMLAVSESTTFDGVVFNGPEVFLVLPKNQAFTGTIGLSNTTFRDCRFKDVGFIVSELPPGIPHKPIEWDFPPHLQ